MWVRMGSFLVKSDQVANLRAAYNDKAIPKVRDFPGNLGCVLLEPVIPDESFVAMTVWEDRAAADKYESSGAAAEVVGLVKAFFAGPPVLRSYESASIAGLSIRDERTTRDSASE
jgi:quinol monooxygenase YgiN